MLNILGRRPDGFHELETLMLPVPLTDDLSFSRTADGGGVELSCNRTDLPVDRGNLVFRAAEQFLAAAGLQAGVRIHLEKRLPLAAGLGGGSANAAVTLLAMDELFDRPLARERLSAIAAGLGSDVPFFLQSGPALATGRGEVIEPLPAFEALKGRGLVLVHPGFGVPTAWAYQALVKYPEAVQGRRGRAREVAESLRLGDLSKAVLGLYNSLEAPVLPKYPLLKVFQDFFRGAGALGVLMSGSGSSTFALTEDVGSANRLVARFEAEFGRTCWVASVAL